MTKAGQIAQLYRTLLDEDGVHRWWCDWQPSDRLTGRRMVDVHGKEFVEVEHEKLKNVGIFRSKIVIDGTEKRWYSPDQIRWWFK